MSDMLTDVPGLPVRPDELEHASYQLRGRAAAVAPAAEEVVAGWRDLGRTYETPEAGELVERMTDLLEGAAQTSEAFSRVGAVLGEFTDALRLLEKKRSAVVDEVEAVRIGPEGSVSARTGVELSVARLQSHVAAVVDDACRDLAGIAAPPPLSLAARGTTAPLVGPRITWQMRTEELVLETMLAPLVEIARGGPGRVRKILADHPEWADRLRRRPPAPRAVRTWWDALPLQARTALIDGAPSVVGALGGVPPLARVAANRVVARDRLPDLECEIARFENLTREGAMAASQAERRSVLERLTAERAYLGRVVSGEVQLVLYEPEEDRIVEMIGTPGPSTERVLTYVPGTFTSVANFYGGGAQDLPQWLTRQDKGLVAFIWKGAEFPGDDHTGGLADQAVGILEANEQGRALPAGESLARFVGEMRSDAEIAAARQIGGGFSWGLVPVTSSELAGARYDAVHSFAGAWVPEGWKAEPSTEYFHWSYTDFLSMAQDLGWVGDGRNPDVTPGFESRVFERPGDYNAPLGGELAPFLDPDGPSVRMSSDPFGDHQLIVSSGPENRLALDDIRDAVLKEEK